MNLSTDNLEQKLNCLTWREILAPEKEKTYFQEILKTIEKERSQGIQIFPKNEEIFNAFKLTSFENLKVVIIGQDPYHGSGQAHGLCFSVQSGVPLPPSLVNIFKERSNDLGVPMPSSGDLSSWAEQGVLLLNSLLSVRSGAPLSHQSLGWEQFTDFVISQISKEKSDVIFLLWGSSAQKKAQLIDATKHHLLKAPHPSPLSAHRGFLGCGHFSKCNKILKKLGQKEILW